MYPFLYYMIFGSRFSGGKSRREGFYAPPASPVITVNPQGHPVPHLLHGSQFSYRRPGRTPDERPEGRKTPSHRGE